MVIIMTLLLLTLLLLPLAIQYFELLCHTFYQHLLTCGLIHLGRYSWEAVRHTEMKSTVWMTPEEKIDKQLLSRQNKQRQHKKWQECYDVKCCLNYDKQNNGKLRVEWTECPRPCRSAQQYWSRNICICHIIKNGQDAYLVTSLYYRIKSV